MIKGRYCVVCLSETKAKNALHQPESNESSGYRQWQRFPIITANETSYIEYVFETSFRIGYLAAFS